MSLSYKKRNASITLHACYRMAVGCTAARASSETRLSNFHSSVYAERFLDAVDKATSAGLSNVVLSGLLQRNSRNVSFQVCSSNTGAAEPDVWKATE